MTASTSRCSVPRRLAALVLVAAAAAGAAAQESAPSSRRSVSGHPVDRASVARALREGVDQLLRMQNRDGSFGSHRTERWYEVMASVPGSHDAFRAATTALAVMALRSAPDGSPELDAAAGRGVAWLVKRGRVRRPNGMELYNVWAFGYGLHCLALELKAPRDGIDPEEVRRAAEGLVQALVRYQTLDGGFGYYDFDAQTFEPSGSSMTFTTATILVALKAAEEAGIAVPPRLVSRAIRTVERGRKADGSYIYGDYLRYRPNLGVNKPEGSTCRTAACHLALALWGRRITPEDVRSTLTDFVTLHGLERIGLYRPVPHSSWFQISGYFYLYGHYYAALHIERMPPEEGMRFAPAVADGVLVCRQSDGAFWDYPLYSYHRAYGTSFAVLALSRLLPLLAP